MNLLARETFFEELKQAAIKKKKGANSETCKETFYRKE